MIQLATEQGLAVHEKVLSRDDVYTADEAFFTGTAVEITPIREIDNRQIGEGKPGPLTQQLQSTYDEVIHGRHDEHASWLTYC